MNALIKTYEPDNSLKKGYLSIFVEITAEFLENRWLIYQLFRRDFQALYRQSFIGLFWVFILPLVSVGTFFVLNRAGIFSVGEIGVPYPVFAMLGLAFWQLFSTGLLASSNALVKAGSMIAKINFSKKSLVLAAFCQSLVSFMIQMMLVGILFLIYGILPDIAALLLPLLILPVILLTFGLGLILSLLNGIMRDVGNVLSITVTFLMFLTPVLYNRPESGFLGMVTRLNPLFYLVEVPRELILSGTMTLGTGYILSALFSTIIFVICIVVFHLTETRVAERI